MEQHVSIGKVIKMEDDLLAPASKYIIKFKGYHPFAAVDMLPDLVKGILHVSSKDFWEEEMRWDINEEPREFFIILKSKKQQDRWSMYDLKFTIRGHQSDKDFMGDIEMEIEGVLRTQYVYSNFIQRGLWWMYNYLFYYRQRRMYLDTGKDYCQLIKDAVQRRLGIYPE
ncbi:MAG: hypothetical protein ABIG30_00785 [Candidatus Aenigmatarchaeota archaeon]